MVEENEKSYRAAIFSRGEIFDSKGVATWRSFISLYILQIVSFTVYLSKLQWN